MDDRIEGEEATLGAGAGLIDTVADWLMAQALGESRVENLVEGCCNRLRAAGIPLWRALLSFRTLHPLFDSVWLIWRRGEPLGTLEMPHDQVGSEIYRQSPFHHMVETGVPFLRRRLVGVEALLDFPVLSEFRDLGATDYLACLVPFGAAGTRDEDDGILGSWATDRPGGFSDQDIRSLLRIQQRLAVACKVMIKDQIARNVLTAYLGPNAGRRVLDGQIRRGDGESSARQACEGALAAARGAVARLAEVNRERADAGHDPLAFGLGLHVGDLMYGNIGVPERLEFSVVGPAANEVARLEGLSKSLEHTILVSGEFSRHLPLAWRSLGHHDLRGVGEPLEVFALPER